MLNDSTLRSAAAKFPAGDPRRDPRSTAFDPYYVSVPFFYHQPQHDDDSAMGGFFFDNGYEARFELGEGEEFLVHFKSGQYTEYVFAGPAMRDILAAYTWLTGRMAPPPVWALGYHQCRWFPYTQPDVKRLARRHREKHIPCDVLWLDIDYMDGYRVFTWDHARFPDPGAMIETLRAEGFRMVTIIDPGVKFEPGYPCLTRGCSATCSARRKPARSTSARSGRARRRFPTSSTPRRAGGGANSTPRTSARVSRGSGTT